MKDRTAFLAADGSDGERDCLPGTDVGYQLAGPRELSKVLSYLLGLLPFRRQLPRLKLPASAKLFRHQLPLLCM
jgi:hypothetical protein